MCFETVKSRDVQIPGTKSPGILKYFVGNPSVWNLPHVTLLVHRIFRFIAKFVHPSLTH